MSPVSVARAGLVRNIRAAKIGDVARVQQFPRRAVGVDPPGRNQPRVGVVEALVGRPEDLTILLGDDEADALIHYQLLRADGDL